MAATGDDEKSERSRRYPGHSLRDVLHMLEEVQRGVGMNGGLRETVAQALGHSSLNGASTRKIASLVHFGLLERDGDRYRISKLGQRYLIPIDQQERTAAIADAAKKPALFHEIGSRFDQQQLPTMLANMLAREFGVTPQASNEVAGLFLEAVEFAGLLDSAGKLRWSTVVATMPAGAGTEDTKDGATTEASSQEGGGATSLPEHRPSRTSDAPKLDGYEDYSIALDAKGRKAFINVPTPVTARDLSRIGAWVAYMQSVIDDPEDSE